MERSHSDSPVLSLLVRTGLFLDRNGHLGEDGLVGPHQKRESSLKDTILLKNHNQLAVGFDTGNLQHMLACRDPNVGRRPRNNADCGMLLVRDRKRTQF